MPDTKDWEKEFDEKFGTNLIQQKTKLYWDGQYTQGYQNDKKEAVAEVEKIKQFISHLVQQVRAETLGEVEKVIKDLETEWGGYANQSGLGPAFAALDTVLTKIKEIK